MAAWFGALALLILQVALTSCAASPADDRQGLRPSRDAGRYDDDDLDSDEDEPISRVRARDAGRDAGGRRDGGAVSETGDAGRGRALNLDGGDADGTAPAVTPARVRDSGVAPVATPPAPTSTMPPEPTPEPATATPSTPPATPPIGMPPPIRIPTAATVPSDAGRSSRDGSSDASTSDERECESTFDCEESSCPGFGSRPCCKLPAGECGCMSWSSFGACR